MAIGACETRHCVEVTIVNDEELEKTESFTVTLERTPDLDSRIILASVNADVEIIDDESKIFLLVLFIHATHIYTRQTPCV